MAGVWDVRCDVLCVGGYGGGDSRAGMRCEMCVWRDGDADILDGDEMGYEGEGGRQYSLYSARTVLTSIM